MLNTRAIDQQPALDALLLELGALPISFPCIAIEPLASTAELDTELRHAAAGGYAWLLVTSVNASTAIEQRLLGLGLVLSSRVGAVGEATATSVQRWLGRAVEFVPDDQHAAALAAILDILPGEQVLIPASSKTRTELADAIRNRGAHPRVVEAYRTTTTGMADCGWRMAERAFDAVAFASPSAVEGFSEKLQASGMKPADLGSIAIACIGPTTFQAAITGGFSTAIQSTEHSIEGLVRALEQRISALEERKAWLKV